MAYGVLRDQVIGLLGVEAATVAEDLEDEEPARQQRVHESAGPRPVGGRPERIALLRKKVVRVDEARDVAEQDTMRLERALRRAGGAAGIDDERRVIGLGFQG